MLTVPSVQVLITTDSCHVHREIARTMPILRRFRRAKLNNDQVKSISAVLDRYTEYVASSPHCTPTSIGVPDLQIVGEVGGAEAVFAQKSVSLFDHVFCLFWGKTEDVAPLLKPPPANSTVACCALLYQYSASVRCW